MHRISAMLILALLMVSPVRGEVIDSLQVCLQQGDSCMQQFNTFEALKYYQRAYKIAEIQDCVRFSMDDSDVLSKCRLSTDCRAPEEHARG